MYKVLFSDFEDVLIDHEDAIPLSTMLALDKINSNKVSFGVISNRGFQTVLDYNKDFPFIDYICIYDGAYLYDVNKKKALVDNKISLAVTKKINSICSSYNVCFYTLDYCNCTKELLEYENSRLIGNFKVFTDFHKDSIYKIDIICPKKEHSIVLEELNNIKDITINVYKNIISIQKSGTSIVSTFEQFCENKKIKMNQIVMLGKRDKNIDLFKTDVFGVAVEDASLKLRRASNAVTSLSTDNPVESIISEYF